MTEPTPPTSNPPNSPVLKWTEVSAPGAALKVYTAPIPEPYRSRIAKAVDPGAEDSASAKSPPR